MNRKQKIVITGGLGYIGSELCKIYSGESRYKDIIVTDNRFISERVKQLKDWGIKFIQTSILDKDYISHIVKDADIVIHLAGITDVAYVKTQQNEEKDRQIVETAIAGTNNILNAISKDCKLIFPSTHVVYEGLSETKFNITEDFEPLPVLTYAKCKLQNEKDIISSGKKYVIVRLGSVYGYSTDTMRINIMPNLFSKMASQNQTIKLFAKGVQYKSLVSLIDVARCLKFMADNDIQDELFHLTNENMTVKEVAELVKKHKNDTNIIETEDEIPNLGYTLSNKKLLSKGFNFLYNIDSSIKEMIDNWSDKNITEDLEYIVKGGKEYIDQRGKISNYELSESINLIGYIQSKAGSVRANHYHPIQEQKCLLVSGKYISAIKDLSNENSKIEFKVINPGDLVVTKPNVAHTMIFLEDSVFLNLVNGDRDHENYGITHTIPYTLVDEKLRDDLLKNYKCTCRCCGKDNLKLVTSFGLSPLANNLLDAASEECDTYPLEMVYCENCHNCQLSYIVPPKKMFDNYLYVSSTSPAFRKHFEDAANLYVDQYKLNEKSLVVDIGSNDGIALRPFKNKGIKVLGIEPAKNIADKANEQDIETLVSYFTKEIAEDIVKKYGKADIVTASNVFAHSDELEEMAHAAMSILKDKGVFIIEVQYLINTISDLTFDNIYHEHTNYWSVLSLNKFFTRLGYKLLDVELVNTHGGSIRVKIGKNNEAQEGSVSRFIDNEISRGFNTYDIYKTFSKKLEIARNNVYTKLKKIKQDGNIIVGYGSPAKATTALNFYGIDSSVISYIVEDNQLKHNKYIPGVNIPIYSKDKLTEVVPNVVVVMAWNFYNEIVKNNQELINKGVVFINIKDLEK